MKKEGSILVAITVTSCIIYALFLYPYFGHEPISPPLGLFGKSQIFKFQIKLASIFPNILPKLRKFLDDFSNMKELARNLQVIEEHKVKARDGRGHFELKLIKNKDKNVDGNTNIFYFIHGGGFSINSADSNYFSLLDVLTSSGFLVVAINYRLAPEFPFPAAVEDVEDGLTWITSHLKGRANTESIVVGGDSAGGNLSLVLSMIMRDKGKPSIIKHQLLIYPVVTDDKHRKHLKSYQLYSKFGLLIDSDMVSIFTSFYNPSANKSHLIYPLHANDFSNLPTTSFILAEMDILRSENELLIEKLKESGTKLPFINVATHEAHGFICDTACIDCTKTRNIILKWTDLYFSSPQ